MSCTAYSFKNNKLLNNDPFCCVYGTIQHIICALLVSRRCLISTYVFYLCYFFQAHDMVFNFGEWVSFVLNHNCSFILQGLLEGDLAKRAEHFFSENSRVFSGWFYGDTHGLHDYTIDRLQETYLYARFKIRIAHGASCPFTDGILFLRQELKPGLVEIYPNLVG